MTVLATRRGYSEEAGSCARSKVSDVSIDLMMAISCRRNPSPAIPGRPPHHHVLVQLIAISLYSLSLIINMERPSVMGLYLIV